MNVHEIKWLRELTGCGVMEARRALEEAGGDFDRAAEAVRRRQWDAAPTRPAQSGAVFAYRHHNGRIGSLVALLCGTDFVARSPLFARLGDDLALHVAALGPADVDELLGQPFVRDESRTVRQVIAEAAAQTSETIRVREFCRYDV